MYETLLRPLDVTHVPAPTPIGEISEKLKQAERKREDKRLKQIAAGRSNAAKRKREGSVEPLPADAEEAHESVGSKRVKTDAENLTPDPESEIMDLDTELPETATPAFTRPTSSSSPVPATKVSLSKVLSEVRGHTSYLTFASLQPFTPIELSAATTPNNETTLSDET
jgi:tRNA (adenine57-N1/adenine58-N1)-methyltransferase